jgi:hypothetical protein
MFFEWHPTVFHDLHESVALLLTWNGTGPTNENLDPLSYDERLELSFHEVKTLTSFGMPGVWTWNFGDDFAHPFLEAVAVNHNSIGRGYETFGNGTAETLMQESFADETSREWYRPLPPPNKPFLWSARDNVNYTETAALSALDSAAEQSTSLLSDFYKKGVHSWQKGRDEAPYAFLIPSDQGDPTRVAQLVALLLKQGIEVHRLTDPVTLSDGSFEAGTYVVLLNQPYRNYAVDLLTAKFYPKDAGEPYDDISWELPANYHLTAVPTVDPHIRKASLNPLTTAPVPEGAVSGPGPAYLLRDSGQEGLLEARYALSQFKLRIAEQSFLVDGKEYPQGSWILPSQAHLAEALRQVAGRLGISFDGISAVPSVPSHLAPVPRLGIWVPWADTDSIGWIRYSLDQRHIPYVYVRDEDIRRGGVGRKFDVLLYGNVDLELAAQINGLPKIWGPMAFKKTAATPALVRFNHSSNRVAYSLRWATARCSPSRAASCEACGANRAEFRAAPLAGVWLRPPPLGRRKPSPQDRIYVLPSCSPAIPLPMAMKFTPMFFAKITPSMRLPGTG